MTPKRKDPTAAERQQRRSDRVKAEESKVMCRPKRQIDYHRESRQRQKEAATMEDKNAQPREPSPIVKEHLQHLQLKMQVQERP